jgi:hypothetical protein
MDFAGSGCLVVNFREIWEFLDSLNKYDLLKKNLHHDLS